MISTAEGLCRGDFCSRFSNLKTISTYSRFFLDTISTESACKFRCDCPVSNVSINRLGSGFGC